MNRIFALLLATLSVCAYASSTPTLYYSDLESGPAGAIVTVYGANLQGTVTVNGATASVVASSPNEISFTVPDTTSGSIMVGSSNPLPFTVRAGSIYYVATNGSNNNPGTLSQPFATIPYAFNKAACGDVIYAMNGVTQTAVDNYTAALAVMRKCTQDQPLAVVGYPGATVTIGSTALQYGIRNPDINGDGFNGFVFANLVIRGGNEGVKVVGNQFWRFVGNDISCPNGGGLSGCFELSSTSNVKFLGNTIHDTGAGGTKYYHSFYASTNSNHIEVGWNSIHDNKSCRGVQFYSTSGSPQYDLIVHDNVIYNQTCDGINFSTVDASLGPLAAYNNLVYHVGTNSPALTDGTPNFACIASLGYGNAGGQIQIYGNTFSDCGSAGGPTAGAITIQSGSPTAVLSSNLVMQNSGEVIYSPNTNQSLVAADHNVLLNNGTAGVVDSTYHPVSGSAAIGAGTAASGILFDLAGNSRPQSGSEDAGAYLSGSSSAPSTSPTATLSSTSLSFGSTTVNTTSSAQNVTLSNTSSTALSISGITLGGTNANQFIASNNCGSSLAAGQSCAIQAQFSPTTTGSMAASIAVNSNASNPAQSIALAGSGAAAATPAVTLTPTTITFGNQTVNTSSSAQTITVTNSGNASLSISGVSLSGTNASAFKLTNGCSASLAAGASCAIQVQFAPTATGTMSASVLIADNATGSPQGVALSGSGVAAAAPAVTLTPTSINFGSVTVGASSTTQAITVANTGNASLSISGVSLSGTNASAFKMTNGCGTSLAAGASCAIQVQFAPTATGTMTASILVADNATGSPQSVSLTGSGVASTTSSSGSTTTVKYSVNNLYFYNRAVGTTSAASTITVTNTGKANFTISNIAMSGSYPGAYKATSNCSSILPGKSCTISVTFTPQIVGYNNATMMVYSNDITSPDSFPLNGRGF